MTYQRKCSASQINMYNACPYKWYLRYKKGIKEPNTIALVKGSMVHSVIEEFYKLKPTKCGITLKNYKTEFFNYSMKVFDDVLIMQRISFGKNIPSYNDEFKSLCQTDIEYATEINDTRIIIKNYMQLFVMQFEQYSKKSEYFAQAWYSARLKFSELELNTDTFIGFADALIEKDGMLIITDWKTSRIFKLGYDSSYELQLKLYAAMYYKLYNVIPDYGCITFVRYGIQCLYPINKETVVEEADKIISEFMQNTESDDEMDYPRNYNYQFCTCSKSKNKTKDWCYYKSWCNNEIKDGTAVFVEE